MILAGSTYHIKLALSFAGCNACVFQFTGGWDIGTSTPVTVTGAIVSIDDDCIVFKPGASFATVNLSCTDWHSISVGSLGGGFGTTGPVQNILVDGATTITSTKAAGRKLYASGPSHGTAVVSKVTFRKFRRGAIGFRISDPQLL